MKTVVGVYNTHDEAVEAIKTLKEQGYIDAQLSMIGKVQNTGDDDESHLMNTAAKEIGVTAVAGSTLGVLAGLGIFAIPGLGFLYGAGALVGAIAGFDIGLIGGGLISALTIPGMKSDIAKEYDKELRDGKILVIVQGSQDEVEEAKEHLSGFGKHKTLETH
jgi:uncharacterized membrane protein